MRTFGRLAMRPTTIIVSRSSSGERIRSALELEVPRRVLVLNGGTDALPPEIEGRLRSLLRDGLARVVVEDELTVVTGGTDVGVFRLFGAGLSGGTAPVIGVAPARRVLPDESSSGQRVPLESHHTHFVLVEDADWGDETQVMVSLADALSSGAPSLAVLANGGSVARSEVLGHVRVGREVVVLAGSGRLADEITDVVTGRVTAAEPDLREIAAGRITLLDAQATSSALRALVRSRLGTHCA